MDGVGPVKRSKRPGRMVLLFLGAMALLWTLLDPRAMLEHVRGLLPATASSIKGEWVGHVDIYGVRDPWHRPLSTQAVIRFKLGTEDYFLDNYGGTGEVSVAGQPPRAINVSQLSLQDRGGLHHYRTSITLSPHQRSQDDPLSGYFAGDFGPGSLTITRDDFNGYEMKGTLQKGTDADYSTLVQQMQLH